MCLIIQTDKPKNLDLDLMECAYENNSDGFGVMFYNNGKIHTHKILPKTFDDVKKVFVPYQELNIPMGIHFRFATQGDTTKALSHPFQVLNKKEHGKDLWVMHNGASLPTAMIDKGKSDTHQFIKWFLKPQLINNPKLLYNEDWQELISDIIGSDKMLFLDGDTKEFTIINPQNGEDVSGVGWLSNTYSIKRGVGYDYDVKKGKKLPINYYGNYGSHYGKTSWTTDWDNSYVDWDYDNDKPKNTRTYAESQSDLAVPTTQESFSQEMIDAKYYNESGIYSEIKDEDLVSATPEEIMEMCEENPIGIAEWIYSMVKV